MHAHLPQALRIEHALRRHLGVFIDVELMLRSAHYARDVLVVCEMTSGTELPELAEQYRKAVADAAWSAMRAAARDAQDVAYADADANPSLPPAHALPRRGWLAPVRCVRR